MSVSGKISQIAGLATYPTNLMWSAASGMVARKFWRDELSKQGWLNTYRACEFTHELTATHSCYWWHSFKNMREDVRDYLELGSWEGQSFVFAGWLFPKAKIIAVDWFANVQANDRFDRNTASFSNRLEKIRSRIFRPNKRQSHRARDSARHTAEACDQMAAYCCSGESCKNLLMLRLFAHRRFPGD